ncbi:AEC family transporter [Lutispora sp.]|jgi:predicted permease|uniref:AEC family transporter n=1 Tax=Lutispora sp. TaxID=2828727 RepID=UPI003561BF0F
MSLQIVINQILILFIIMCIGFIAKKSKLINESTEKSLSNVLLNISLPALMLSSINVSYDSETLPNMLQIFYITLALYIAVILFANITAKLFRFKSPLADIYINLLTFANVGFIGFPIANAIFGSIGVLYATVANLIFNIFLWTYGILIINKEGSIDFKKLLNIGTIVSAATIIIFILKIRMPSILLSALDMTGDMTTPISMMLIGSFIADINSIKSLFDWKIGVIAFFRLLMIPFTLAFILSWLGINDTVISLCTILAAAPSGSTNAILAKQFNAEPTFTSVAVFVTTLLFLVTLPSIIFVLNNYILI